MNLQRAEPCTLWHCCLLDGFPPLSLQLLAQHKPPQHSGLSHPLLMPITICSPQPSPDPLSTTAPTTLCAILSPRCNSASCSLLLGWKGERWGRERFPQLCAAMFKCVKRQSLSPLQPTSCCCHKSRERRGGRERGGHFVTRKEKP